MATFVLTWNPARWHWEDLEKVCKQTAKGKPFKTRWSTGNSKKMVPGDRVFLLKQGVSPRGIIAAGTSISHVSEKPHFDPERNLRRETSLGADVVLDRILNPDEQTPLSVEDIKDGPLAEVYWRMPASGVMLADEAARALESSWISHLKKIDGSEYLVDVEASESIGGPEYIPEPGDWREIAFRQIKARRGQQVFRQSLRERYGDNCMISGCRLLDVLEAAHIKPYRGERDNHPENGLLLRADLHTLFDLDLIGIEPKKLVVQIHPAAREAGYAEFDGVALKCSSKKPSSRALKLRWESFLRRKKS